MHTKETNSDYDMFINTIKQSFSNGQQLFCEALIRYFYVTSLLSKKDYKVEVAFDEKNSQMKHLKRKSNRFDLLDLSSQTAIEFKYHRKTESSRNCSTTKAGSCFGDLNRLSILKYKKKYFIYAFDNQMNNYYKKREILQDIFSTDNNDMHTFSSVIFPCLPKEAEKVAFSSFSEGISFKSLDYSITRILSKKIDDNLHLVILQVKSNL